MNDPVWESSVLKCDAGEDCCPVCNFLGGKRDPEIMLAVVMILDRKLAREEALSLRLASRMGTAE